MNTSNEWQNNNQVTNSHDVANEFIQFFNCLACVAVYKKNFLTRLQSSENTLCKIFAKNVTDELAAVHDCVCNVWVQLSYLCFIVCFLSLTTITGR